MKLSFFFFFFFFWCGTVRIWLANLADFNFFFYFSCFCLFKFGCPHTVLPCILHACTHNNFFFLGLVVQPQQCLCVVCLWVLCCVFMCYKCFCFWWVCFCFWWVCLCVGLGLLVGVFVCCVFTYYPSFNFGIETWKKTI